MGAGEEGAKAYAEVGLTAYDIGDEAIVDMTAFSLGGPGMKSVRASVSRLQRRGYTARVVRHATLTASDFAALSAAARAWRGDGGDERGFSMALGRLADPLDGSCVLVEAHDADGQLRGFLSFAPWGRTGLSLDLMRRDTLLGTVRGILAAQLIKPQARVLANDRGISCVTVDYDVLRGLDSPDDRLF